MRKFGKRANGNRDFKCIDNPNGCARNKRCKCADSDGDRVYSGIEGFLARERVLNVIEPDGSKKKYEFVRNPMTSEIILIDPDDPIARERVLEIEHEEFEENLKAMLDYLDEHEDEFEGISPEEACSRIERDVISCKRRNKRSTLYWLKVLEDYCLHSPHADEIGVTEMYPMIREAISAYVDK